MGAGRTNCIAKDYVRIISRGTMIERDRDMCLKKKTESRNIQPVGAHDDSILPRSHTISSLEFDRSTTHVCQKGEMTTEREA